MSPNFPTAGGAFRIHDKFVTCVTRKSAPNQQPRYRRSSGTTVEFHGKCESVVFIYLTG